MTSVTSEKENGNGEEDRKKRKAYMNPLLAVGSEFRARRGLRVEWTKED